VIAFIERTWFLWWMVAVIVILRSSHLFSSNSEIALDGLASGQEEDPAHASDRLTSGSPNRLSP
jgi:hypothetical protein